MDELPTNHPHHELLSKIRLDWDQAEADIKLAELVCLEVVIPAINELRYAGRRVVDAIAISHDATASDRIVALYSDSQFFCQRARHDAIDAAVAYIISHLEDMLSSVGPSIVLECFSELPSLRLELSKLSKNIVLSRQDRENRTQIYKTISECDFPELVKTHEKLLLSEELMIKIAEKQKEVRDEEASKARRDRRFGWAGIIFGVLGVVGLIATLLAWKYPHLIGG